MLDDWCVEACLVFMVILKPCSLQHPSVGVCAVWLAQAFFPAWWFGVALMHVVWAVQLPVPAVYGAAGGRC